MIPPLIFLLSLVQASVASPDVMAQELPEGTLRSYVTATDYPGEAIARGEQGNVRFSVLVGVDGRPKNCSIVVSSGSTALDDRTCKIMRERLRFQPARNAAGQPTESIYTGTLNWRFAN